MAGLTPTERNTLLSSFISRALYASLHTADPGTTGASEISGGAPAYARKAIAWGVPAAGSVTDGADPVFDVPGGGTAISYLGYWTAATGGTFVGSRPLDAVQTYATQGTYAANSITENLA